MSGIGKGSFNLLPPSNFNLQSGIVDMLTSNKMPVDLAQSLSTKFSANEWALIGTNGLIGENGLIGTNGVIAVKNYSGIPESVLWKIMKKKPLDTFMNDEHNVAMNAILYRIENMLKYGIILQNGQGQHMVSFCKSPQNIAFDVNDTTLHTVGIYMPFFNGNALGNAQGISNISWTTQIYTDTFQDIFLTLITEFNTFCDKSIQLLIVSDVTTPPVIPPPTIVKDTIANFKSIVDSSAFTYSF